MQIGEWYHLVVQPQGLVYMVFTNNPWIHIW